MWVYNKCDFILMRYFFDLIETCMEPGLISGGGCALFFFSTKRVMNLFFVVQKEFLKCVYCLYRTKTVMYYCTHVSGKIDGERTIKGKINLV